MHLEIASLWSPGLTNNVPQDINNFDILLHISLQEKGQEEGEVFTCRVCSRSALSQTESGTFITSTLCLAEFRLDEIKKRIEKLLARATSCQKWDCVIEELSGYLDHAK